jgi:hypothetical protein
MSYAHAYILNRAVFAIVILCVCLGFAMWILPEEPPQLSRVTGTVVEINTGSSNDSGLFSRAQTTSTVSFTTAKIRLENGQEFRLPVFGQQIKMGQEVALIERTYADGEKRYAFAPQY